jgi:hypothetical protein
MKQIIYWVALYKDSQLQYLLDGPFVTKELAENRSAEFTDEHVFGSLVVSQEITVEYTDE